ncbi:DUF5666 domain-containing protein [Microlunatus antarcticus]|uniref:DUF5666 domain-containing protein n=1 Tax=Microlunatus antarcticus TaxID=53388 RepID=A0A7W5JV42_9ACTN|nr:DUF5666 domain-containing protein [Microlunatus antarcticus]MBB3326819.1 hypothetical protein [Microlunatus antarcticus]
MSEDLEVDHDRQAPPPYSDDDDGLDEELLLSAGRRPSLLTRVLLGLLILAVGVFVGVQVARVAGGSAGAAGAGAGQARRSGAAGSTAPRAGAASTAPAAAGEVTAIKAHTLVLADQGASRTVTFTDTTTVTEPYAHGELAVGDVVTVLGSRAADGSVNATSIVVR